MPEFRDWENFKVKNISFGFILTFLDTCPICLFEFKEGNQVFVFHRERYSDKMENFDTLHMFHFTCLKNLLKSKIEERGDSLNCPICTESMSLLHWYADKDLMKMLNFIWTVTIEKLEIGNYWRIFLFFYFIDNQNAVFKTMLDILKSIEWTPYLRIITPEFQLFFFKMISSKNLHHQDNHFQLIDQLNRIGLLNDYFIWLSRIKFNTMIEASKIIYTSIYRSFFLNLAKFLDSKRFSSLNLSNIDKSHCIGFLNHQLSFSKSDIAIKIICLAIVINPMDIKDFREVFGPKVKLKKNLKFLPKDYPNLRKEVLDMNQKLMGSQNIIPTIKLIV